MSKDKKFKRQYGVGEYTSTCINCKKEFIWVSCVEVINILGVLGYCSQECRKEHEELGKGLWEEI